MDSIDNFRERKLSMDSIDNFRERKDVEIESNKNDSVIILEPTFDHTPIKQAMSIADRLCKFPETDSECLMQRLPSIHKAMESVREHLPSFESLPDLINMVENPHDK